jgi:diaminopimelate decarboxylase
VLHGNNKSDEEIAAASADGVAYFVADSLEDFARAGDAPWTRLVRVTPGIDADTHERIRTGHVGSKFGVPPDEIPSDADGLHVHIGSQLFAADAARAAASWLVRFAGERGLQPRVLDLGGGLGVPTSPDERAPTIGQFVHAVLSEITLDVDVILEPGRSLVAQAGVTLYRVGSVKRVARERTWVAVDGGISDNPRPQLYDARYTALVSNRADERATGEFGVAGKHCESGDVLIESVALAAPRRGDVLAVPVTGAYTLAMASNYNGVPRPAAVLVRDGEVRLIRRRETVDDLLALEVQ